ncbi:hypothetical protein Ddye_026914 [Dipteronia dyeriana]|uniref:Protochlorophyllide reductase n=1 Tax=Dipteronia dyeriana TaxID=168575 RepID=A0AAD9WPP8_9ROSI|nr:hypothetical protein Ddye_026914 [Dipteronia dyeriana]
MLNVVSLLPHCKNDNKVESKSSKGATLNELVELKSCSSCLFFEVLIHMEEVYVSNGNTNTLAGNVPPKANLGDMRGLAGGLNGLNTSSMIDGGDSDCAKAYKDSKVCNMLTMQEFHRRYHKETGITFASLYPGCIATTGLFREHIPLFRLLFPPFQKYITKG